MPIKLVVFDMAGTTVKDDNNVSRAFQAALKKYGYEVPIARINPLMGYEKNQAITQMLELHEADKEKITTSLVDAIHREFVKQMISFYQFEPGIEALSGAEETFAALHKLGVQVGVNTGFSRDIADTIIQRLQWREKGLIDYVVGSDEVEKGRPYPFMIKKMMEEAGITEPLEIAKVGDTEVDVREGQNAGCRYVIGVTTGAFTREELEPYHPTHIIDQVAQVIVLSANNMKIIDQLRAKVAKWPYGLLSVMAAVSAFGAYTSMYAFRKAFAAGTFTGQQYFHVDYKVWLVIAQIIGYTMSKFYGIKFISELKPGQRAKSILFLIGIAWLALLFFAIVPAPYNIVFLFINGFPLGLIWGLVFGYLEGRKSTEFMAAVLSISLIFASGFVKTVARTLMGSYHLSEYNMPFITGALFVVPLLLFVLFLELMPPPTAEDIRLRTKRLPMDATERKQFLQRFLPGIILTLVIYVLLTIMRDVRDNFEVEIWASLGVKDNTIYTKIDSIISVAVLVAMSLLILVRQNLKAFRIIHLMIIFGCALIGIGTVLFAAGLIGPMVWMTFAGLGLYLGYVPYNAVFFERLLASFHYKGNVGFLIYVADSMGYLGSVSVLLVKELGQPSISWGTFFRNSVMTVAIIGGICATLSLLYFLRSARKQHMDTLDEQLNIIPA